MAINVGRITRLTTNLYRGATNPATDTFFSLTNGVPPGGQHLGASGVPDITPGAETAVIDSENQLLELGAYIKGFTLEISVRLKEWTTEAMAWAMYGQQSGNGFFGASSTVMAYDTFTVVFCFDESAGVYGYFHAYKCYVSSPMKLSPAKAEPKELEFTLKAVADTTRNKSDSLYQIVNPANYAYI